MATYKITAPIATTGDGVHAFSSGTLAGDTLIVDKTGSLNAAGIDAFGAYLDNTKAWKVSVNAAVASENAVGVYLQQGNTQTSSISVGSYGIVYGGHTGLSSQSNATITNAGTIRGLTNGIYSQEAALNIKNFAGGVIDGAVHSILTGQGADTVTNAGQLKGTVNLNDGNDGLTNTGIIFNSVLMGGGNDRVNNNTKLSGMLGDIDLGAGNDRLTNGGVIAGSVFGREGNDLITNNARIDYDIFLGNGNNTLTNSGSVFGYVYGGIEKDIVNNTGIIGNMVDLGDGDDRVTVTGKKAVIGGDVDLGAGNDKLTNSGTITGIVFAREGNDTITNSGTITKDVLLGNGDNTLTNSGTIAGYVFGGLNKDIVKNSGTIDGFIFLDAGDDVFTGGSKAEKFADELGNDTVNLGGGDDTFAGWIGKNVTGDDLDKVNGGAGVDTYDVSGTSDNVYINIGNVAQPVANAGTLTAYTATANGGSTDLIRNFENVKAGAGNDFAFGSSANNVLEGNGGTDTLYGFGGLDSLKGGSGSDVLIGGAGRDILAGGTDNDTFVYASVSDSRVTDNNRDSIVDFTLGDRIDLSAIDANTKNGIGNDSFSYIGDSAFGKVAGQLRVYTVGAEQIIEGDVNGDGKADFSIEVWNTQATHQLSSSDFLL